jgi:hypothetical protein
MRISTQIMNGMQAGRVRAWIATLTPISRLSPTAAGREGGALAPGQLTGEMPMTKVRNIFCGLWARMQPVPLKPPAADEFGRVVPFNVALEDAAAQRFIYRRRNESDKSVADRWALAVCELIEEVANENAELERELEIALKFSRGETPCGF